MQWWWWLELNNRSVFMCLSVLTHSWGCANQEDWKPSLFKLPPRTLKSSTNWRTIKELREHVENWHVFHMFLYLLFHLLLQGSSACSAKNHLTTAGLPFRDIFKPLGSKNFVVSGNFSIKRSPRFSKLLCLSSADSCYRHGLGEGITPKRPQICHR